MRERATGKRGEGRNTSARGGCEGVCMCKESEKARCYRYVVQVPTVL